jgi:tellurite resistance protein
MPIDTKRNAINLFCKLAQADGEIVDSERELLEECIQELNLELDFDALVAEATELSIKSLCAEINDLSDRFFIRVRCHMMVKIDGDVDTMEQAMLDQAFRTIQDGIISYLQVTYYQLFRTIRRVEN